jgi:hypothetical protein
VDRFRELADAEFELGFPTPETAAKLRDELFFQRAVQAYMLTLPAINIWAMKEASERQFGAGYNILPTWEDRITAKTLVTTPNSDVLYAMAYLDLEESGPLIIDAPAGVQGILDDFWQRPVHGPVIDGHLWTGDVGRAGPDKGKGGTYILLGPADDRPDPEGGFVYRSRTRNVFLFWRAFFRDPADLAPAVETIRKTVIRPLDAHATALPMEFPNASDVLLDMLFPRDGSYFDMLDRYIQNEAVDPYDLDVRGFLHTIGIEKGHTFAPSDHDRELLDLAAKTAFKMSKVTVNRLLALEPGGLYYDGKQWVNTFAGENTEFQASGTFTNLEQRTSFFVSAYSDSPGMVVSMVGAGAKYPATVYDSNGDPLDGAKHYTLTLPADVPAALFWSVTVYDSYTSSGLDNGQKYPSINAMDQPKPNPDGSYTIHFGPTQPEDPDPAWLATVPGKGFLVIVRLYGPEERFFTQQWQPSDITPVDR